MKQFKKIFVALLIVLGLGLASCKKDTTLAKAKEELNITYTEGENITLPPSLGDVVITWESNKPAVISATGVVTQGVEAVEVKLTATLTYKGKTEVKYFTINVPVGIVPGAAKAALIEHYKNTLGSVTYKVTGNVELVSTINGVSVTWQSDNPDFFSNSGVVTLPTYSQGNQSVSLKATLGDGDTYTFRFNLTAQEATTAELIEEALDLVTTKPAGEYQEQDFVVMNTVTIAGEEVPVTWATDDEEGMTTEGKLVVFFDPAEKNVTLTASITYNEVTLTRDVVFKIRRSLKTENFDEALVPENVGKKVMVTKVSYFGSLGTDGFYMVDLEGHLAYFYGSKPSSVVEGKLYNVMATVAQYFYTAQFTGFTFTEIEGGTPNTAVPVEVTLNDILTLPKPSSTGWNQHSYITLKNVKVRIDGTGDYNTHLISPDLAADATLNGTNSILIYYKSNIEDIRALNGKVIDEIQIINNGYRSDHSKWNFNFLGKADDIKVTLTPAEKVANVKSALQKSFVNAYYKAQTIELPTQSQGTTITWASNNEALINPTTGAVTMPEGAAVDVKLTATITIEDATDTLEVTVSVGPLVVMNIADFTSKPEGYIGMITGVVTGMNANRTYMIEDATGGVALFSRDALTIGKQVTIVGANSNYHGLIQINKASDVDLVIVEGVMPPAVELPDSVALTAEGLLPYQSRRITVGNFTITKKVVTPPNPDKNITYTTTTLTLKRGEETITIRYEDRVPTTEAAKAHLESLQVEQTVKLVGSPLGWYRGPQFGYNHESEIVVVAAVDPADQANEVAGGLTVPATITDATALTLPTSGNYSAVITWVSSNPEVIKADGTVVLPAENMTVTLTATVKVGTASVEKIFNVRVKVEAGMEIIESYELAANDDLELTGVVTVKAGSNLYIQDDTAAIYIFSPKTNTAAIGDKIKVVGKKGLFNGLHQVAKDSTVTVLESGKPVPEAIEVTAVANLVATLQSQRINMNGLTVKALNGRELTVTDGTNDVLVRSASSGAEYDHLQLALIGQEVKIKGMLLGWFNNPQFNINAVSELEYLPASDAIKVDNDMLTTVLPTSVNNEDVTLPATGKNGSAITWVSSHPTIIGNDGKMVAQPAEDTTVTFTGTFKLGEVTKTKEYEVIVKALGTPEAVVLRQSDFGTTNSTFTRYDTLYTDDVDNGTLDPTPAATSSWDRLGGNYNNTGWDYVRMGGKLASSLADPKTYLQTKFVFTGKIEKIVINIVGLDNASGDETVHIQTSTDGTTWTTVAAKVTAVGDLIFDGLNVNAGTYFRFVFERQSSSSNYGTDIKTITFYGY